MKQSDAKNMPIDIILDAKDNGAKKSSLEEILAKV